MKNAQHGCHIVSIRDNHPKIFAEKKLSEFANLGKNLSKDPSRLKRFR